MRAKKNTLNESSTEPLNLLKAFKQAYRNQKPHIKYICEQLCYMFVVLILGSFIQLLWNSLMNIIADGQYHITVFEAAILWICIY